MPCSTLHDFCEMACSSLFGMFPAPTISRSITNLGMIFFLWPWLSCIRYARSMRSLSLPKSDVLRPKPRRDEWQAGNARDKCPASTRADAPFRGPEACFAGPHNGLVPMFNANLIEDPCDVVANRLY